MQVLVVASKYPPEYAGAGHRIHSTYKRLVRSHPNLKWSVLCSSVEYRQTKRYQHDGISVTRIGVGRWRLCSGSNLFQRFINAMVAYREAFIGFRYLNSNIDVVHVFGTSGLTALAIMWARFRGIPLLVELVTTGASPQQTLPGIAYFWKPTSSGRVAVIAISEALAEVSRQQGFAGKVWSRPNPVDETRFYPAYDCRVELRTQLTPFMASDTVMVAVAKSCPRKTNYS